MPIATARLAADGPRALAAFQHLATRYELPNRGDGTRLTIELGDSRLLLWLEAGGTALHLDSPDAAHLQTLRDWLAEEAAAQALPLCWVAERRRARPDNQSVARVVGVEALSPSYRRVTLTGPELQRLHSGGLHFRLLFGPEGAAWPQTDDAGLTQWPGGPAAWHRPVYTTRKLWQEAGETFLSFDVFQHDGGRVTDWTARVTPGTEIALTGPGGGAAFDALDWLGLVGDETALPVAVRHLEALPAHATGEAHLFVPDARDRQPIARPEGVRLHWHLRGAGHSPLDALRSLCPPSEGARHLFFAAEKAEAAEARRWLATTDLPKGSHTAAAYWARD